MTEDEHYLTCLAEEAAEVAQRVSKALRFGLSEVQVDQPATNAERIAAEMGDLLAVYRLCELRGLLPDFMITATDVFNKRQRIEKFMEISRREGVLS